MNRLVLRRRTPDSSASSRATRSRVCRRSPRLAPRAIRQVGIGWFPSAGDCPNLCGANRVTAGTTSLAARMGPLPSRRTRTPEQEPRGGPSRPRPPPSTIDPYSRRPPLFGLTPADPSNPECNSEPTTDDAMGSHDARIVIHAIPSGGRTERQNQTVSVNRRRASIHRTAPTWSLLSRRRGICQVGARAAGRNFRRIFLTVRATSTAGRHQIPTPSVHVTASNAIMLAAVRCVPKMPVSPGFSGPPAIQRSQ
jgi:hypothetical protein